MIKRRAGEHRGQRRPAATSAGEVLHLIRLAQATTSAELIEATGLSRATLDQRLDALIQRKLVITEAARSTGGRPPRRFAFNPGAGVILAADLGATHSRIAVADLSGRTLASRAVELVIADGPDVVLARVLQLFDEVLAESGHVRSDVWATGVGVPGPVEFASSRPVRPPIMPGWDGFDIRGWFADQIPGLLQVDNDVNAMALGEYWRSWRGEAEDLLFVKVGSGIGAGLIAHGELFRGARGAAGDIGHIRVDSPKRVVCDCGNENCLEAVASGRALASELREAGLDTRNTRDVVELVAAGNPVAVRAVRTAGRCIGEALASAVNLLNPAVIVIGGDLAEAHSPLLAGVREAVYQRSTALATQSLQIVESRVGLDDGVEGCFILAIEDLLSANAIDDLIGRSGPSQVIA